VAKAKAVSAPPQRSAPTAEKRRRMAYLRRLSRHSIFALHVFVFIIGSIFIWSLPASQPDQQFDSLTWLVILCAHGMLAYRRSKVAFVFHLLMYSAGNAANWNIFTDTPTKIALTAGWTVVIALIGLWLYRRLIPARPIRMPTPAPVKSTPPKTPKTKAKRQPEPEPEYVEEEEPVYEEDVYYEPVEDADSYVEEEHYIEYPQEMPDGSAEPALDPDDTPVPQRRRKSKRG
jgi:hypothetical protein